MKRSPARRNCDRAPSSLGLPGGDELRGVTITCEKAPVLLHAIFSANPAVVEVLLELGADPNAHVDLMARVRAGGYPHAHPRTHHTLHTSS